jgi:hypothetical protein
MISRSVDFFTINKGPDTNCHDPAHLVVTWPGPRPTAWTNHWRITPGSCQGVMIPQRSPTGSRTDHDRNPLSQYDPTKTSLYIEHAHCTLLCTSYLSYQYNLVTLNTLSTLPDVTYTTHSRLRNIIQCQHKPVRPVYPLEIPRSSH